MRQLVGVVACASRLPVRRLAALVPPDFPVDIVEHAMSDTDTHLCAGPLEPGCLFGCATRRATRPGRQERAACGAVRTSGFDFWPRRSFTCQAAAPGEERGTDTERRTHDSQTIRFVWCPGVLSEGGPDFLKSL